MLTKLWWLFLATLSIYSNSNAQINLVRNPDFEITNNCDLAAIVEFRKTWSDAQLDYPALAFWINPNKGTPDYFNGCCNDRYASTPSNFVGFQFPKNGSGYAGISNFSINKVWYPGQYREYIQTKLEHGLEGGRIYFVSFFVSISIIPDSFNMVTNDEMSLVLTKERLVNTNPSLEVDPYSDIVIKAQPTIIKKGQFPTDTSKWYQICGLYKAKGGEEWLTIGNFKDDVDTDTILLQKALKASLSQISTAYFYIDDVEVSEVSEAIFFKRDTAVCAFPAEISAVKGFDRYLWNTGDTTQTIKIKSPGKYWVLVSKQEACTSIADTIEVSLKKMVSLEMKDTTVCPQNFPVELIAPAGFQKYEWSNGLSGQMVSIDSAGKFSVQVEDECGTQTADFQIVKLPELPDFALPDSLQICENGKVVQTQLSTNNSNLPIYQWSSGANSSEIWVDRPGIYWLKSFTKCEEKTDSTIIVGCPFKIFAPNVFSPNDDGWNDEFVPYFVDAEDVSLSIYNRWGELVFYQEGKDSVDGWNGEFCNRAAPAGVYTWVLKYKRISTQSLGQMSGSLTLVR